jgi:hypothetical protein
MTNVLPEADHLSAEEIQSHIQRRLDTITQRVAASRQTFDPGTHDYTMFFTENLRTQGEAVVVNEATLFLYKRWMTHGPQKAVTEAFEWIAATNATTSSWSRAIGEARRYAAVTWLYTNNLLIQSVDISWSDVLARM